MPSALRVLLDVVRGALIGTAEVIPGVSGGTVALIVGIYDELIGSAGHLVRGVVASVADPVRRRGLVRARLHFSEVAWGVLLPVLAGMAAAVLIAAALLAPLVESRPVETRAVFFGLILVSILVPVRMTGRWGPTRLAAAALAAAAAFALTAIPPLDVADPPLPVVAVAAAFAVCALVLPGVSGSFLLVVVGLYAPTLAALNARDLAYIAVFAAGAIVGLGLFVPVLQWLLERRRGITLAIMTGLMIGSLRSLWPWQSDEGGLLAPSGNVLGVVGLVAVGCAVVAVLLVLESRLVRQRSAAGVDVLHPDVERSRIG